MKWVAPLLACPVGATGPGIGRAYAEELASRGLNIGLISRNQEKLQMVAKGAADTYKVETDIIVADFSSGREIYDMIREALQDRDIGILVNNVGVLPLSAVLHAGLWGHALGHRQREHVAAASLMVHIVLHLGMVERKKGAIDTISSGSCCKPTPAGGILSV